MELFLEKNKKIILTLIFGLAVFLIFFHFTDTPKVWVDEGIFTETARNLALHGVLGLQTAPGKYFSMRSFLLSVNYPVIFPVSLSFKIFGIGIWQARGPMLGYMFLLVILFYLFTKERYKKKYGLYPIILSILLLISFSPFYGNGRPVQGEVPGLAFLVLGSLLLLYFEESNFKSKKLALLSGLAYGLSAAIKPIFLLGISASLLIVSFLWFKKIENKKTLAVFNLGYLIPVFLWFIINFPTMFSLVNFIPSYLYFSGNHGSSLSVIQTIFQNFLRFFTESTPVLFLFLLAATLSSFSIKYIKNKEWNISSSESVIFIFIILNWLGYLNGTGWYRYFFPAHILLYLFFPMAMVYLAQIVHKEVFKKIILAIPVALILFQFYHLIFLSDTSFTVSRTRNIELSDTLSKIGPDKKILFYDSIEAIIFLKNNNYSQYVALENFLIAGDKDALTHPTEDFILMDSRAKNSDFSMRCYSKKSFSKYFLFQKIDHCK